MLTLGIETSSTAGSVALVESGQCLAAIDLSPTGRRHARTLVAELKSLFEQVGYRPQECRCVAVSVGPGSFTGLRVGVICAKTFAYAVGCPIVAVDTLQVIAANAPQDVSNVVAVMDALRGELFHARYLRHGEDWRRQGEVRISPAAEVLRGLAPPAMATGPGLIRGRGDLPAERILPTEFWPPRAEVVARLGERLALAGHTADLWLLQPFYLRRAAAEERAAERDASVP
jgi:tRNA threonylcarbamoyladenosine biosynthesis protein TsaB